MIPRNPEMHPMQPVVKDKSGLRHFRENAIVRALLDRSVLDLDRLMALDPSFSREDREQDNGDSRWERLLRFCLHLGWSFRHSACSR